MYQVVKVQTVDVSLGVDCEVPTLEVIVRAQNCSVIFLKLLIQSFLYHSYLFQSYLFQSYLFRTF